MVSTNCQFQFRKKHSTNLEFDSAEELINLDRPNIASEDIPKIFPSFRRYPYLHETILEERDANKSVFRMFLDFVKASDCVNHQILLNKLKHYGIRGIVHSLFCLYLTDR